MTTPPSIIIDKTEANPAGVKVLAWAPDAKGAVHARSWPANGKDHALITAKGYPGSEVWRPEKCSVWFLKLL